MTEKKILYISLAATLFFALFGTTWGLYTNSGMIIFDGIYSFISLGLTSLSLVVLKEIHNHKDDEHFPFGKAHFEPLLIIFKSVMLMGMCLISSVNALSDILEGGRLVDPGLALIYAVINTLGCIAVAIKIRTVNRNINSGLLDAEYNQWLGDTLLSLGVLLGFGISYISLGTGYSWISPYADPALVLLMSGIFIAFPIKSFISAFREFLYIEADDEHRKPIQSEAERIACELQAEYKLRMVVVGREISIELNFLVKDKILKVRKMDEIRRRLEKAALTIREQHWINVNFTELKEWL
ncbi:MULTISPECIES: cation diffusion facilitator family transporter [unclassified Oceanispirochaeta]|uniref:cation diffusion facilitator family transporter n=1 Tax=unclassified Oceanispirochaeta TaxID=2635722 RepID=UPI0013149B3C|nr:MULTISPECIES: cation transporter [unclassified Oceanispirochaeta]MBF9018850.1 cation transporter [Oceanispirochaeta sp. M2]NPD75338.1 cation transporter [Oceanispirochaeta sp. M1]